MIKLLMIIFIKELFLPKYNISKHIYRKGEQLVYVPKFCIIIERIMTQQQVLHHLDMFN